MVRLTASALSAPSTTICRRRAQVVVRATFDKPTMNKPEMKRPEPPAPAPAKKLFDDAPQTASPSAVAAAPASSGTPNVITIEYQRQRAKEMNKYFKELKLSEVVVQAKVFGWTPNNEISNGRWTMFGLLVGMLTEYGTGVDFVDQIKLMITYMGIADLE